MTDLTPVRGASGDLPAAITNFYREEFVKHQQLLQRQREYYSEPAVSAAEAALARTLARLEQFCLRENADIVVSRLLRQLDAITNLSAWSDPKNSH